MISLPTDIKIWLGVDITDMRNGFNGLAAKVQTTLRDYPISSHVFITHDSRCHICSTSVPPIG